MTGAGFKSLSNSVKPTIKFEMTLKETWSVASDQSRLGGSVPRLTRKCLSLPCGVDLHPPASARSDAIARVSSQGSFTAFNKVCSSCLKEV